jgi:hypothetical protein
MVPVFIQSCRSLKMRGLVYSSDMEVETGLSSNPKKVGAWKDNTSR